MMEKRVSIKNKRKEAPQWVFTWQRSGNSALAKWFSAILVAGLFALLLSAVRIRVTPPFAWAAPKVTVIYVADDAEGRALRLRAREGGPFPSRFQLSEWQGVAALEQAMLAATRHTPPPYVPTLRDLPAQETPSLRLTASGEPVFPKRRPPAADSKTTAKLTPVPVIYPLSGIQADDLPRDLPAMEAAVDVTMTAEAWRFLLRLDAAGNVRDCVSLAGGNDAGISPLEAWLRRVTFKSEPGKPSRWIAVGVGFANQPATNGSDAH